MTIPHPRSPDDGFVWFEPNIRPRFLLPRRGSRTRSGPRSFPRRTRWPARSPAPLEHPAPVLDTSRLPPPLTRRDLGRIRARGR